MSILELLSQATSLKLELTRAILGQSDSLHKRYLAEGKQVCGEGRRRAGIFASRRGRVAALYGSVCQCDQCSTVTVVVVIPPRDDVTDTSAGHTRKCLCGLHALSVMDSTSLTRYKGEPFLGMRCCLVRINID